MDDTIYRQDAIDAFDKQIWNNINIPICKEIRTAVKNTLEQLPSAQPEHKIQFADKDHVWIDGKQYISLRRFQEAVVEAQPERKTGRWIPMEVSSGRDSWKCSVCGRRARGKLENLPYCHCGAKMEVEHD